MTFWKPKGESASRRRVRSAVWGEEEKSLAGSLMWRQAAGGTRWEPFWW